MRRIAGLCEERGPCCRDITPKEAYHELLRGRGLYQTETAYATLAAYKHGAVSMPEDANNAPRVMDILPDSAQQYLVGLEEKMLRRDTLAVERELRQIRVHTDRKLTRNRRVYGQFIKELHRRGLVRFTRQPLEEVGVFFVWKKGRQMMRMILDCRRANCHFVGAPGVDLLTAEGLSNIESEADDCGN